jgi:hypothetical protein
VVRSIGACYTYISEEKALPAGLHEKIMEATLGTATAKEIRAPWTARAASRFRLWLDPIISPQLASVATMILVAVLVLTNTVSADGSISGVYDAGLALAERTGGQSQMIPAASFQEINDNNRDQTPPPPPPQKQNGGEQHKDATGGKSENNGRKHR